MTMLFQIQRALEHYKGLDYRSLLRPKTGHGRALLGHADELFRQGRDADPADLEATFLKMQGLLIGLKGDRPPFQETSRRTGFGELSSSQLTAGNFPHEFLDRVAARPVFPEDRTPLGVMCRQAFLAGALDVFPEGFPPYFLETADYWMRAVSSTYERVNRDFQRRSAQAGRTCAKELHARWRLGCAAGFSPEILNHVIHERRISDFIRADGWLSGCAERLQGRGPDPARNVIDEKHYHYIREALEMNSLKTMVNQVAYKAALHMGVIWIPQPFSGSADN